VRLACCSVTPSRSIAQARCFTWAPTSPMPKGTGPKASGIWSGASRPYHRPKATCTRPTSAASINTMTGMKLSV
jgi:hypothetical protein